MPKKLYTSNFYVAKTQSTQLYITKFGLNTCMDRYAKFRSACKIFPVSNEFVGSTRSLWRTNNPAAAGSQFFSYPHCK